MSDITMLKSFLAVYRTGTFTRAAATLHLTQPAVSVHVRSLEAHIGRQLFHRGPRGVTPTSAGLELAQAVGEHLDALEESMALADPDGSGLGETIYLGGPAEFMGVRVVPELAPLVAQGLRLRWFFDIDKPIVDRLVAGEIDLAVTTAEWRRRGLEVERLCYEHLVLVASPGWARRIGPIDDADDGVEALRDVPLIAYSEDLPLVGDYWREVFGARVGVRAGAVANSLAAALALAVAGAGVTVLPQHVCDAALRRGEVTQLHTPELAPRNQLYLAWRSGSLKARMLADVHGRIQAAATNW